MRLIKNTILGKYAQAEVKPRQCWRVATTAHRAWFLIQMNKNHIKVGGCHFQIIKKPFYSLFNVKLVRQAKNEN